MVKVRLKSGVMGVRERKERQRRAREQLILDHALEMVLAEGYLGLNMDRLAGQVEYSKGTLYQHFSSKEDILLALVERSMSTRHEMFVRAARHEGCTRERIGAIGVADYLLVTLYPGHCKAEMIAETSSIWEKASADRRERVRTIEAGCVATVAAIVAEAIELGDLPDGPLTPHEITFGLWTMSVGVHTLMGNALPFDHVGIENPYATLHRAQNTFLDGVGWTPRWAEMDIDDLRDRLRAGVLAPEFAQLAQAGLPLEY